MRKTTAVLACAVAVLGFYLFLSPHGETQVPARSNPVTCVRDDVTSTVPQADGQQTPCRTNERGAVQVTLETKLDPGIDGVNIGSDPCSIETKTTTPISVIADTVIIPAVSAKRNYICSMVLVAATAEIVNIVEGTGTVCATGIAALLGSTTDANGASFAANGGVSMIGGSATVLAGKTVNVDTCIRLSTTNRVSGYVTWAQR